MADIESTISGILSDPDAMNRIRELGKSLGLTEDNNRTPSSYTNETNKSTGFDISSLASMLSSGTKESPPSSLSGLSGDSLKSLTKFLPMLSKMNTEDETTALLNALKPFLSEAKRKRLEDAGRMLKIMHLLPFIRSQGIF